MTRYLTRRPRANDWDDEPEARACVPTIVVTEPADDFMDTGLLDAAGDPIFRMRSPIGFMT